MQHAGFDWNWFWILDKKIHGIQTNCSIYSKTPHSSASSHLLISFPDHKIGSPSKDWVSFKMVHSHQVVQVNWSISRICPKEFIIRWIFDYHYFSLLKENLLSYEQLVMTHINSSILLSHQTIIQGLMVVKCVSELSDWVNSSIVGGWFSSGELSD